MPNQIPGKGNYNFIDLFAGAGGLSEGFIQAGFNPIAHVEMNAFAAQTLITRSAYYYLKQTDQLDIYYHYLRGDIAREDFLKIIPNRIVKTVICETMSDDTLPGIFKTIDGIMKIRNIQSVDVVVGGPPCQAYSLVGRAQSSHMSRPMSEDPRNELYRFPHLLAVLRHPVRIHVQRLEQNILLGIHDPKEIFQTLAIVVGCVHMNMQAAGCVYLCARFSDPANTFLKLGQLRIGQLRRYHFHGIVIVGGMFISGICFLFQFETGIAHEAPFLALCIRHIPAPIVVVSLARLRAKVISQSPRRLLTGNPRHLHFHAETLIFDTDHAAAPAFSSSSTARIRQPMASITLTVTLLPACLYT